MYYTITEDDVGKGFLRIFGQVVMAKDFIGRVLPKDVGKRVVDSGGVLQVENDEQFERRRKAQP